MSNYFDHLLVLLTTLVGDSHVRSEDRLRERLRKDDRTAVLQFRWYRCFTKKDENDWVKKCSAWILK